MWGCDYGPMSGGWWGGFFPGSLLSLLIWGLVIFLIVYLAIRIFKAQAHGPQGPSQDRFDSEAILKARFARGEISREEFIKMRQILSQP
ncbi:MAG: SHOCT domain-containing protein [Syntrophaceae bacterium]|nr:SHOCT domain-containing protein [Syntrophaceae bacterium]